MFGYIYQIYHPNDPETRYIGSTKKSLKERLDNHKSAYKRGKSGCSLFQIFEKYGVDVIIEMIMCSNFKDKKQMEQCEYSHIQAVKCVNEQKCFGSRSDCIHEKRKNRCIKCKGNQVCEHEKERGQCKECQPRVCCCCDVLTSTGNFNIHCKTKKHKNNLLK